MKTKYNEIEFKNAIKNSFSIAETCRILGIKPVGGNYKTIHRLIKKYDVDISHFTGQGWNVGLRFRPMKTYSLDEILIENSEYRNSPKLKQKLFDNNLKKEKCECCNNTMWEGKKIPLELHHINGVNTDNRIENLQILCYNCHGQTKNFRKGKSALSEKRDVEYRKFKEVVISNVNDNLEPSDEEISSLTCAETRHGKPKSSQICQQCGNAFNGRKAKFCSVECYREYSKQNIPKVPELIQKFKEFKSYVKVGKYYSVSDNTVKKWCKSYGIVDMVKE